MLLRGGGRPGLPDRRGPGGVHLGRAAAVRVVRPPGRGSRPEVRSMVEAKADFILGLDLGQAQDPTAMEILKRRPALDADGRPTRDAWGRLQHRLDCVHLERWPLGTPYPTIVEDVKARARRP